MSVEPRALLAPDSALARNRPGLVARSGEAFFSVYAWAVFGACALLGLPLIILVLAVGSRLTAYRFAGVLFRLCLGLVGVRVTVRGLQNVQPGSPHVLMGNHVSFLDGFVLTAVLPFPAVAMEKRENFKIPVYGWFMGRWGNIPIDRKNRDQAIVDLENAKRYLAGETDRWVVVMPEGTRTRNGRLGPFKKGGFHLALSTGAPIVPYSLVGAYEVQRTGSWLVHPGRIDVVIHPPIVSQDFGLDRLDDLMAEVRRAVVSELPES